MSAYSGDTFFTLHRKLLCPRTITCALRLPLLHPLRKPVERILRLTDRAVYFLAMLLPAENKLGHFPVEQTLYGNGPKRSDDQTNGLMKQAKGLLPCRRIAWEKVGTME